MLRKISSLLFLLAVMMLVLGCEKGKDISSKSPSANLSLAIQTEKTFDDWKETKKGNSTYYTSPDGQSLIFVVSGTDQQIQAAIDQLNALSASGFTIDKRQPVTIGNAAGQAIEMTHNGNPPRDPPMKFQINLVEQGGKLFKVGIVLPPGEASFLTDPEKWPAFLNGIKFAEN